MSDVATIESYRISTRRPLQKPVILNSDLDEHNSNYKKPNKDFTKQTLPPYLHLYLY